MCSTVTEFLLDAVSNAGRSGKMDLFSYVPPDYIKPGKQDKGTLQPLALSFCVLLCFGMNFSRPKSAVIEHACQTVTYYAPPYLSILMHALCLLPLYNPNTTRCRPW